jgi:hypothetical protein
MNFPTRKYLTGVVDPARSGEGSSSLKALRGFVALDDENYLVTNYYRSNHLGMFGTILGCDKGQRTAEGYVDPSNIPEFGYTNGDGKFTPDCQMMTPYAQDQDMAPKYDLSGRAMGKAGYPAPYSAGLYMYSHCDGLCYEPTIEPQYIGDGVVESHRTIRSAKVPIITDPFDTSQSEVIACASSTYNCWDAREVVARTAPLPAPAMTQSYVTALQVVNARSGELDQLTGPNTRPYDSCGLQGCAIEGWQAAIAGIEIIQIYPWTVVPFKGWPLFEAPNYPLFPSLEGFSGSQSLGTFPLAADNSVQIVIPAGIHYRLQGVDLDGNIVAMDPSVHAAIPGEVVRCFGCHDGHSEERATSLSTLDLAEMWDQTLSAQGN